MTVRDWSFMPGRRNRKRRRNLARRINYSDEGELTIGQEVNRKATGLRWRARRPRALKFVDDGMTLCKVNMDAGQLNGSVSGGRPVKVRHDLQSQNLFRRVVRRAEGKGMVVNKGKTNILCVSDAQTYKAAGYILDADGNKLGSTDKIKVLGFHMDSRPSCHAHIKALRKRMRDVSWILRHLRLSGFSQPELATVYTTVVRPVLDYCVVVCHSMLTDEQDQIVERMQAQALKNIYGYRMSYVEMREQAGVTTHRARRIAMCDKFAEKARASPRFCVWFPKREVARRGRHAEQYQELPARTDRLMNSLLFYMRRRLNGKQGKTYGERNRRYRERMDKGTLV